MLKIAGIGLLIVTLYISCIGTSKTQRSSQNAIPALHVIGDSNSITLKISRLSIDVTVTGNIATTTFDITFYNSLDRILEGEFDFPLADGQQISRYALDINGTLREGVVVEKATARIAFENTVRQNIDPGLVEKTKGNNFRTRIYPIPAKGYKRVVIATEQTLPYVNKELFYQLLLTSGDTIDNFSLKTTVLKSQAKPVLENNELQNFRFQQWQDAYIASYEKKSYTANHTLAFTIPAPGNNGYQVFTEQYNDKTYFYISSPMTVESEEKQQPSTIGIIWDVSGSAEKRNIQKEIDLVEKYLAHLGQVNVLLIPFSVTAQPAEEFSISNGNAPFLLKRLKNIPFDGGTQLGAIDLTKYTCDEILLFTDGLSTFGKKELVTGNSPVTVINSSPSADYSCLKKIAQQSHGTFINLNELETTAALEQLTGQLYHFISFTFDSSAVEELYCQPAASLANGFFMAGILKQPSATVTANFGFGNTVTNKKVFTLSGKDSSDYSTIKRAWASLKIAHLDLDYTKNKAAITQLGKTFSIVTQNTSLLVLDRVEDYVQFEIVPPAELQKEYYALLKEKLKEKADEKTIAFTEALDAMQSLKSWYHKKFNRVRKPKKATEPGYVIVDSAGVATTATPFLSLPDGNAVIADSVTQGEVAVRYDRSPSYGWQNDSDGSEELMRDPMVAAPGDIKPEEIKINAWKPDAPYLAELEKTPENNRYAKYLELKKQYASQPSFFVDVARFFTEKKNKPLAIQILSNAAEMKLEDPELLRIVANQLLEIGETGLAIELFKNILEMREEEPQSYRDLALAYNEAGNYNEAISLLYKLITGAWDGRFGEVKGIAINELNAIVSAHKNNVNTDSIDKRFIYPMPLDMRIVVGWSTNNSDIDLWVTDPDSEKCYYEYKETHIGGKISKDVTQGYGPEEFSLKKAVTGDYVVNVNLYGDRRQTVGGPISISAELFTDYGKATQKRKLINLRVTSPKEVINIGTLTFDNRIN